MDSVPRAPDTVGMIGRDVVRPAGSGSPRVLRWGRVVVAIAVVLAFSGCSSIADDEGDVHQIGVLLPGHLEPAVSWAVDNVNAAGGIDGTPVELVWRDTGEVDLADAARELADNPRIAGVVGPESSADVVRVADLFIQSGKPFVTPSATAGELSRAFATSPFFWRTVESDIAQLRTMLLVAFRDGAESVALLTADGPYGSTFFDLFGFTATELGLDITAVERYRPGAQDCGEPVAAALAGRPDVLIAVASGDFVAETVCIAERWREIDGGSQLLLADSSEDADVLEVLGERAEGLRGTGLAADPDSGFAETYEERFDQPVPAYAANAHDAALLIAYGLVRSDGQHGAALATAMQEVVDGRGEPVGWDAEGVAAALAATADGQAPDISGATGPLGFDPEVHTDLTSSTYRLWEVRDGVFRTVEHFTTGDGGSAVDQRAAFHAAASERTRDTAIGETDAAWEPGDRTGMWALLVATSAGWDNYRHQADVFAQYQLLRANGVPDERIIVVAADDLAEHPDNPEPGVMRYTVDGDNIHPGVSVDYHPDDVTATDIMAILGGQVTDTTPTVIDSSAGDDVYVFLVGHGNDQGLYLGLDEALPLEDTDYSIITPRLLADTIDQMAAERRYRRVVIAVESCHGGVLGTELVAPHALLVAGANPHENSLSTNYDPALGAWLANEFAYQLHHAIEDHPDWTLGAVIDEVYLRVNGSHTTVYGPAFDSLTSVPLSDYMTP